MRVKVTKKMTLINPRTGRKIKEGGPTHRRLLADGVFNEPQKIGEGLYGCVYYPPPVCNVKGVIPQSNWVMKVETKKRAILDQDVGNKLMDQIKTLRYTTHYILPVGLCERVAELKSKNRCKVEFPVGIYYPLVPNAMTFEDVVGERDLSPERSKRIAHQLMEMVFDLHRIGIVHGDLHFENVLVDMKTDDVYFIDFSPRQPLSQKAIDADIELLKTQISHLRNVPHRMHVLRAFELNHPMTPQDQELALKALDGLVQIHHY